MHSSSCLKLATNRIPACRESAPNRCVFLILLAAALSFSQTPPTPAHAAPSYEPYANTVHQSLPAWSPGDREILYSENYIRKTAGSLFRVSSEGGKGHRLVQNDSSSIAAAWSPDGKQIVVSREAAGIWISDPQGKHLRQLTGNGASPGFTPAWSPDGKQIAYTSFKGTTPQIILAPTDGSGPGSSIGNGFRPRFSPDGSSIAYTAAVPGWGTRNWVVYIKQIAGGKPRMLASSKGPITGWPSGADWSPDGRHLVFVRHIQDRGELLFIDVTGDSIVRTIPLQGLPLDPAWSHDGKKIAFMLQTSSHPGEIQTVRIDGGPPVPITRQKQHVAARLVSYQSADEQRVQAYMYEPAHKKSNGAGLLWIHGGEPTLDSIGFGFSPEIEYFADQGFTVLVPDFRPGHESTDIQSGALFLHEKAGVDTKRIGLVGFSFGGFLSLLTASKSPGTFAAVVDFFGPTDLAALYQDAKQYRPVIVRGIGGTPDEKPDSYRPFSRQSIAEGIACPVLILHGTSDELIPIRHSIALSEALQQSGKQVRFVTLSSGHGFSIEDDTKAFPEVAIFLNTYLRSGK
jgi:dipeptidyl aminopeptidase/acylaminoacyl peptidase